jgi:predicted DNA-binding antitoxin AbrB/MazE fold protein
MTIHAVYENGVFRPTVKVDLPDACEVEVEIRQVNAKANIPTLDDVHAILGRGMPPASTISPRGIMSTSHEPSVLGHGRPGRLRAW